LEIYIVSDFTNHECIAFKLPVNILNEQSQERKKINFTKRRKAEKFPVGQAYEMHQNNFIILCLIYLATAALRNMYIIFSWC
jgi:hypothetical protein